MRTVCFACRATLAIGFLLLLEPAPPARAAAPVVSNVQATQIAGTYHVSITYDVSDADGDSVTAQVLCSTDNGVTYDLLPRTLTGAVNVTMAPGAGKEIVWDAGADYPGRYWTQVVAKVFATDEPVLSGEMVLVPGGEFTMGQAGVAEPVHTVQVDSFYIDKYEVTNAQFQQFVDAGGYSTRAYWSEAGWYNRALNEWGAPCFWTTGDYHSGPAWPDFPVTGVSWYEAEAYAIFAGKRLPTEAEWEKAARGTDQRTYPWGEGINGSRANYLGSGDPYESSGLTTPVGFYDGQIHSGFLTQDSPSPYGAYDMAGNVLEWVSDWYGEYSADPATNPTGPLYGSYRVLRGGAWNYGTGSLRSALRNIGSPYYRNYYYGFRCARTLP